MQEEINQMNRQINSKRKYYKKLLNSKLDNIIVMHPL